MDVVQDRLKLLRDEKDMKQKDVADALFLSRNTIAAYESGRSVPSVEVIMKYADYFNTTTDYILGRTDERHMVVTKAKDITITHEPATHITEAAIELLKKTLEALEEDRN